MPYKSIKVTFFRLFFDKCFSVFSILTLISCHSDTSKTPQNEVTKTLDVVNIDRLICGGHFLLAVVEKKLKPNVPDNIANDYFDMRFVTKTETNMRGG